MSTQMLDARAGKITEEMEKVALMEGVTPEFVREGVAAGRIVIPKNKNRDRSQICGIGAGLDVKVNGLMGTSSDRNDMAMEARKLRLLEECGANAFMDLSTGDDIDGMRKQSLAISNIAAGCVPVYQASVEAIKKHGSMVGMTSDELFETLEKQAQEGMDFMAIHSALNWQVLNTLRKTGRVTDVVSRGGSFLTAWMFHNQKENPPVRGIRPAAGNPQGQRTRCSPSATPSVPAAVPTLWTRPRCRASWWPVSWPSGHWTPECRS